MLSKDFKEFVALFNANAVEYLKANKRAVGRARDLDDLKQLP